MKQRTPIIFRPQNFSAVSPLLDDDGLYVILARTQSRILQLALDERPPRTPEELKLCEREAVIINAIMEDHHAQA